jgi:MoaA/NifB/PqqE/SkfB family radical SAM enzyme
MFRPLSIRKEHPLDRIPLIQEKIKKGCALFVGGKRFILDKTGLKALQELSRGIQKRSPNFRKYYKVIKLLKENNGLIETPKKVKLGRARYQEEDFTKNFTKSPWSLLMEVTTACNMNCIYCSVNCRKRGFYYMTPKTFKKILNQIVDMGVQRVTFTGGKPFLKEEKYGDFLNGVRYAEDNNVNTSIFTNGSYLRKYLKKIIESRVSLLTISLDTADVDLFKSITNTQNAEKIYQDIIEITPKIVKAGIHTRINCVLSTLNVGKIFELIELAKKIGVHDIKIIRVDPMGRALENKYLQIPDKILKKLGKELYEYKKHEKKINVIQNLYFEPITPDGRKIEYNAFKKCEIGRSFLIIKTNGDVVPCFGFYNRVAGNLMKNSLKEIWYNSPVLNEIRAWGAINCPLGLPYEIK